MGSYYTKLNGTFYAELLNAFLYEDGTAVAQNQKQKKQRSSRNRTALPFLNAVKTCLFGIEQLMLQ